MKVVLTMAGSSLLQGNAIEVMKELFKYALVITPNKFGDSTSLEQIIEQPCAVLIKKEILGTADKQISIDQLFFHHQKKIFQTPFIQTNNLHGTGCSYSSAITANLALGKSLEEAIQSAKEFINVALIHAPNIGKGSGTINHQAVKVSIKI